MKSPTHDYGQAQQLTALSLQKLIDTTDQLTHLSLPERTALVDEIARVVPAGNVPSLVAAGLVKLQGRAVPLAESRRNLSLLMHGMQTFLDKAVYQAFFVGPATVLSAYQMLLKLAGKDLDESFPEGTWQFYVEFGLREDSGRHTCETVGFQAALERDNIRLSHADEMAAWLAASAWLLDRYHVLLANEWTEHVRLRYLASAIPDEGIVGRWQRARPFDMPADSTVDFAEYRRVAFEIFCNDELAQHGGRLRRKIEAGWKKELEYRADELTAYQRQMTILAALNPGEHSDTRLPLAQDKLGIAVIERGRYYVVNVAGPLTAERARALCVGIHGDKPGAQPATLDRALCAVFRHEQQALRRLLPDTTKADLERLRMAPIILNWDVAQAEQPLAEIRSGRRGVGDHALTVFRTTNSAVFDLSHIFFDGPWGMAVAEILTNQAIRFARQLSRLSRFDDTMPAASSLTLDTPQAVAVQARKMQLPLEVSAETTLARLDLIQKVRRNLQSRNEKLRLTVNDILVLFRSLFGPLYQPSTELMHRLASLETGDDSRTRQARMLALNALEISRQPNPALLLPIDASKVSPRERIYPTTFRNPFGNLMDQHRQAMAALDALETAALLARPGAHRRFEDARRDYLTTLQAFGQVIQRYKDVTLHGESVSTATIKLLAGLPLSVQRMLDSLPSHFDVLNDVVKGQEVFSNVGQVAPTSSLTRFSTAKDDNEKKVMAWGIITDANGQLRISLRDLRPHVAALVGVRQQALAQQMAQEYADAYALCLNTWLEELLRITRAKG